MLAVVCPPLGLWMRYKQGSRFSLPDRKQGLIFPPDTTGSKQKNKEDFDHNNKEKYSKSVSEEA